jgi:cytochrome c-type biogenesis protein CcsB
VNATKARIPADLIDGSEQAATLSSRRQGISLGDGLFLLLLIALATTATLRLGAWMDAYDLGVLWAVVPTLAYLAHRWPALRRLSLAVGLLTGLGVWLYAGSLVRAEQSFLLKYLLASQSAILWMGVLFLGALLAYWVGLLARSTTSAWLGTALTWGALLAGFTGLLMRWYESYLIGSDVGHIPISNLYEVFVLFSLIVGLYYLHFEKRYQTRQLGGFVMLVVTAALGFLAWYAFDRQAHEIQPLVPALKSWWMKIHVPANFIGYGTFSLAAMVAVAYLIKERFRGRFAASLPPLTVLDDWMYKSIAIGFAFFTVATILGALWAAEAWGAYWQWDPKETWALIVWLNYAAWLHMRLVKGLRGVFAAYWALIGLLVTAFAFLGVNMFLSGLHSYGQL